ncbi:MAG: hypothetical protein LBK04_01610 [Clostridiales Family XIII bacterium]|nr:hypothetical protein [Clostridiales Family XIII bacterium]
MDIKQRTKIYGAIIAVLLIGLYFYGNIALFISVYLGVFIFVAVRAMQLKGRKRAVLALMLSYFIIFIIQLIFYVNTLASPGAWLEHPLKKLFAIFALLLPVVISRYVSVSNNAEIYLPSLKEATTIGFAEIHDYSGKIKGAIDVIQGARKSLSPENIRGILGNINRNDSFDYVNNGTLTEDYFKVARQSMGDPYIYIIITDTGSPTSEIISVFTQKQFNHASLSFDADMKTIVSYNGGEGIYPPGLNQEMLSWFHKKPDSGILIYRLSVSAEQKMAALERIGKINREGSAYNTVGLLTNKSYKPNIMYCSQFVYSIIESVGAAYFDAPTGAIHPTDFIEKDYYRKLEFVEAIRL